MTHVQSGREPWGKALLVLPFFLGTSIGANASVADAWLFLCVACGIFFMGADVLPLARMLRRSSVIAFLLALSALSAGAAGTMLRDGVQQIVYVAGTWLLLDLALRRWGLRVFEHAVVRATVLSAIIALTQYWVFRLAGVNLLAPLGHFIGSSDWIEGYYRAAGTFRHFNQLAVAMIPGFTIALFRRWYWSAALIASAALASGSRSGVGALVFVFLVLLVVRRDARSLLLCGLVAALGAAVVISSPDLVSKRLSIVSGGGVDQSTLIRLELYARAMALFAESPWFGIGLGQFDVRTGLDNPESSVLFILVEFGVAGVLVAALLLLRSGVRALAMGEPLYLAMAGAVWMNLAVHPFLMMSVIGPLCWAATLIPIAAHTSSRSSRSSRSAEPPPAHTSSACPPALDAVPHA